MYDRLKEKKGTYQYINKGRARETPQNMYCPVTVTFADWNSTLRS